MPYGYHGYAGPAGRQINHAGVYGGHAAAAAAAIGARYLGYGQRLGTGGSPSPMVRSRAASRRIGWIARKARKQLYGGRRYRRRINRARTRRRRGGRRRIPRAYYKKRSTGMLLTLPYANMPPRVMTKFNMSYDYTLALGAVQYHWIHMEANNLYDQRDAGGIDQPLGFDQWAAFFKNYNVWSCKIKIDFHCNTAQDFPIEVFYNINDDAGVAVEAAVQTLQRAREVPQASYLGKLNANPSSKGPGYTHRTFYATGKLRRAVRDKLVKIDEFDGTFTADPSALWHMSFGLFSDGGNTFTANTATSFLVKVSIIWSVEMFNREYVTASIQ